MEVVYHEMANFRYAAEVIHREKWAVDLWEGERLEGRSSPISSLAAIPNPSHYHSRGTRECQEKSRGIRQSEERKYQVQGLPDISRAHRGSRKGRQGMVRPSSAIWKDTKSQLSRVSGAVAVLKYPSGSVHPHKLATAFLKTALESPRCKAFSWTPVSNVDREDGIWLVNGGARGTIRAKEVVVCTNAHTGWLFKGTNIEKQWVHAVSFQ